MLTPARAAASPTLMARVCTRTQVRMSRVMYELPERLLVDAERDVVHPVRSPEKRPTAARPPEVAVLPDDAPLLRVHDHDPVVEVVVDRDVPVREHDGERRVVQFAPAGQRPVAPED